MDVNETKLLNAIKAKTLRPAIEAEIRSVGAIPGYASPIGLTNVLVVVDDAIPDSPNLVAGANEEGYHMLNVNYGRDYTAQIVTDIVLAEEGDHCPRCEHSMRSSRGVEVGNIFKLGTRYSESMGCMYLDRDGKEKPVVMGSYGIGSGRLLASVAEAHHDDLGLIWPISVAPFHVHLVALRDGEEHADQLYERLRSAGVEVLYDDRHESPGVKFNDADLIGIPIRVTLSARTVKQDEVEIKLRSESESERIPLEEVGARIQALIQTLTAEIAERVKSVQFDDQPSL